MSKRMLLAPDSAEEGALSLAGFLGDEVTDSDSKSCSSSSVSLNAAINIPNKNTAAVTAIFTFLVRITEGISDRSRDRWEYKLFRTSIGSLLIVLIVLTAFRLVTCRDECL